MLTNDLDTSPLWRSAEAINSAMLRVYNYMLMAIAVSGVVAMGVASSQELMQFLFTGITKWVVMFLPLVAIFIITPALNSDPPRSIALAMLLGFAAIMGMSMAAVFYVYTAGSIAMAFFSTCILFGTMSVYGYFTKRSLESMGQFLFVGLIAVVIASIVNIFIGSSVLTMVISAIAIVIFLGLTAYDTQQIREMISQDGVGGAAEVSGALTLYLDFINIFVNLLQLFGNKNSD
jgi:FtsH-binding integral membrane protein